MEGQTRRGRKRIGSEEDEGIYKEMMEIEQRRLEEEDEAQKKMKQRMEEEKEKMREEREQRIRPKLTDEQRKIRKAIYRASTHHRLRLAKAATDENFKRKLDACRQRGLESTMRKPKQRLTDLTAEQKRIRTVLKSRDHYRRKREDESWKTQRKIKQRAYQRAYRAHKKREAEDAKQKQRVDKNNPGDEEMQDTPEQEMPLAKKCQSQPRKVAITGDLDQEGGEASEEQSWKTAAPTTQSNPFPSPHRLVEMRDLTD